MTTEPERAAMDGIAKAAYGRWRKAGEVDEWRRGLGISRPEVRAWLESRGIQIPSSGYLPRAAYEGFVKAHPERFGDAPQATQS